jgi:glycine dehydrogenase subunit 1
VPHSADELAAMLAAVGVASQEELYAEIPAAVRLRTPLDLPAGISESELFADLRRLAAANQPAGAMISFLGAGAYDHYVPAVVDAVTGRSEFATAYTPYQPERSQGVLQTIFEYQTAICELTGLPVANASMYDAGTALAEAVTIAVTQTGRKRVLVSAGVHPEYRQVLVTETAGLGLTIDEAACDDGVTAETTPSVATDTAVVVLQQPNFFGGLEDMAAAAQAAHAAGALFIAVVDPIALGILAPPGDYGADIAVGDGQALGNPLNFGGPYLGFMAVGEALVRRLPGRLVGETVDGEGRRGFVLTLQTREQHIRREKATSNICSNHALNALAALVYLSWLGKQGLPELALLCARKAHYLRAQLLRIPGVTPFTAGPIVREFALRLPRPAAAVIGALADLGYLAGVDAGRFYAGLDDVLVLAVTERRTRAEMDAFVKALADELAAAGGDRG